MPSRVFPTRSTVCAYWYSCALFLILVVGGNNVSAYPCFFSKSAASTRMPSTRACQQQEQCHRNHRHRISSASFTSTTRTATNPLLTDSVFETVDQGGIAIVDNFLSQSQVSRLRNDAQSLFKQGEFITDALAGYGQQAAKRDKSQFDPSKDRSVLPAYIPSKNKLGPFVSSTSGDSDARNDFTTLISRLRQDMAVGLQRPGMDTPDGIYNHEISYTRFGPGAYLKRHNDEHHEELKGVQGWSKPTRRSLSWLIYLNEPDWDVEKDGGSLRTYPRVTKPSDKVGSRNGDLQIGWLRPTPIDPVERPVFLDGRREGESGNCALYIDSPASLSISGNSNRLYMTKDFKADPYLFVSTDWVVQHVLINNSDLGNRFHYVEPPKSLVTAYWEKQEQEKANGSPFVRDKGEYVFDVAPTGGTLVMFDSVCLPHEVMSTFERERWATSGWFHESQQDIPTRQKFSMS